MTTSTSSLTDNLDKWSLVIDECENTEDDPKHPRSPRDPIHYIDDTKLYENDGILKLILKKGDTFTTTDLKAITTFQLGHTKNETSMRLKDGKLLMEYYKTHTLQLPLFKRKTSDKLSHEIELGKTRTFGRGDFQSYDPNTLKFMSIEHLDVTYNIDKSVKLTHLGTNWTIIRRIKM